MLRNLFLALISLLIAGLVTLVARAPSKNVNSSDEVITQGFKGVKHSANTLGHANTITSTIEKNRFQLIKNLGEKKTI